MNDENDLERRVGRLEWMNRTLLGVVALLVALPLVAARGAEQATELVRAERIQLVDGTGQVRVDLRHDSTETGIFILDDAGDTRLGAAQFSHGGGGYALHGPGGRGAAVMYLRGDGSFTVYDADGAVTSRFPAR